MVVRETEKRLPPNFDDPNVPIDPVNLGQFFKYNNGDYLLVSYLSSPVALGSVIDYVVFVLNGTNIDKYIWEVFDGTSFSPPIETEIGIFEYETKKLGNHSITVKLKIDGVADSVGQLTLNHEVVPLNPALENFFNPETISNSLNTEMSQIAIGGDEITSRELINNFRNYILDATSEKINGMDIPARLLAGIAYKEMKRIPRKTGFLSSFLANIPKIYSIYRNKEIENVAEELNNGGTPNNAIGVLQITPLTTAMVLTKPGTSTTYLNWHNYPIDKKERKNLYEQDLESYKLLDHNFKIDFFNLLRFPRSNIEIAVKFLQKLKNRGERWPYNDGQGTTSEQLLQNEEAVSILATEFKQGSYDLASPIDNINAGELDNSYGETVVKLMTTPFLTIAFYDSSNLGFDAYGGYELHYKINLTNNDTINHIKQLQRDLAELGFLIVGNDDGDYGLKTEWAVREFQIYSKMKFVAKEDINGSGRYIERLTHQVNLLPYVGKITGVVDAVTRVLIQYWKANQWRCPVIFEASIKVGQNYNPINGKDNLWLHNDFDDSTSHSRVIRARDFSGYYKLPEEYAQDLIIVGKYSNGNSWGGPTSTFVHGWKGENGTEVLPQLFLGVNEQQLGQDNSDQGIKKRSTFKIIRVISEIECLGFVDSINCWDTAYTSLGVCHWTIGRPGVTTGVPIPEEPNLEREGELIGYLAYLKQYEPEDYEKGIQFFGVDVDKNWIEKEGLSILNIGEKATGKNLFKKAHRKYSGWLTLQQLNNSFLSVDQDRYRTTQNKNTQDDKCGHYYFKTWHWFYRLQMATRILTSFGQRMWDFARIRIRDILTVPWGVPNDNNRRITQNGKFTDRNGNERDIEIGDVFTSEKAVALLLRWHINLPVQVVSYNFTTNKYQPANKIFDAFESAKNENNTNFAQSLINWGENEEKALIKGILDTVDALSNIFDDLKNTMNFVDKFPPDNLDEEYPRNVAAWKRSNRGYQLDLDQLSIAPGETKELKESRLSFKYYSNDLPDPPYDREISYYNWG